MRPRKQRRREDREMKILRKAADLACRVVELAFGLGFPTPRDLLNKHYPYLAYAC